MKSWRWIVILSAAAAVGILLSVILPARQPAGNIVCIYSGGELIYRIDTSDPGNRGEYTVTLGDSLNTVVVDADGIRVVSASCPDGLCIRQGYLRTAPIVCLPNRLVIEWLNGADQPYDAIAGR